MVNEIGTHKFIILKLGTYHWQSFDDLRCSNVPYFGKARIWRYGIWCRSFMSHLLTLHYVISFSVSHCIVAKTKKCFKLNWERRSELPRNLYLNPYRSNVELHSTAVSPVTVPMSNSNRHIILQCFMLVFPKFLLYKWLLLKFED